MAEDIVGYTVTGLSVFSIQAVEKLQSSLVDGLTISTLKLLKPVTFLSHITSIKDYYPNDWLAIFWTDSMGKDTTTPHFPVNN